MKTSVEAITHIEAHQIKKILLALLTITVSLQTGCVREKSGKVVCPGNTFQTRILQVKPLYQAAFNSGPAALTMALAYRGKKVSLEKITADLAGRSSVMLHPNTLLQYVSAISPSSRMVKSDLCEVVEAIAAGSPVILLLDLGDGSISSPRYVIAVGYAFDRQFLVFHNGYSEYVKAPFGLINEKWEKAGALALFID